MKPHSKFCIKQVRIIQQRGVVLFFSLIALLVLSLAAVALIRSVDTSNLIAGNLAFKQAATTSGDAGVESAVAWIAATDTANSAKNVLSDTTHTLNITDANSGYYSNVDDAAVNLFTNAAWDAITSIPEVIDSSGNRIRYIIQRMCRNGNVAVQNADCLYSGAVIDNNGQSVPLPQEICSGAGCPTGGQSPQIRITTRTIGLKNTISYVQAFVY